MKDKRTYTNKKEHGEDMSHENESKIDTVTALTDQYRTELHKYKEREALHLMVENQLSGTKQIIIEMSATIKKLKIENDNFQAEIARLREEIQLLEMQIKK